MYTRENIKAVRKWQAKNQEKVKKWKENNRTKIKVSLMKANRKLKLEILSHYSNNKVECACCKENKIEFLCIDHLYGDGAKHRKELKKSHTHMYHWLKKNNYPKGFRVLCCNCNMSLGLYGYCPHQTDGKALEAFRIRDLQNENKRLAIKARNSQIREFKNKYPNLSFEQLAHIYNLTRQRLWQICKKEGKL